MPPSAERLKSQILGRYPALGYPRYRRYWLASFASVGGTQFVILGQGWLVFELSGSPLDLGYLGAAAALPNIAVSLFGGALADRFDKRRILMTTSLVLAALMLLLAALDASGMVEVWHVLVIAATSSLVNGLEWPTRSSFYPLLVERPGFMSAVALNSVIWQSTRMTMPALGGVVIAASDTHVVFLLAGAGFLVMFGVIRSLDVSVPPRPTVGSTLEQIREGVSFIAGTPLFAALIALSYTGMFFAQSYTQLMPAFAELLGAEETGYGLLLSAGGVGAVLGTVIIGAFQHSARLGRLMLAGALVSSTVLLGFAAASAIGSFRLAMLAAFAAAAFGSVFHISAMTVMQLRVPDALRGRVMGMHTVTFSLAPLGGLWLGYVASRASLPMALTAGAAIHLLVLALVTGWTSLRRLDGRELAEEAT